MAALAVQSIARATAPHLPTLAATLTPLLAVANAGSFLLDYQDGAVVIEQGSFAGCDLSAIDSAVADAPDDSAALNAKVDVDDIPLYLRAFFQVLVDQINTLRTQPSTAFPSISYAQAWTAVKNKIDTL